MFKKLLNKIKSLFSKKEKAVINKQTSEVHKEENNPITAKTEIVKEGPICSHCHKILTEDKISSTDEDGVSYIWCTGCNYVNKLKDGIIIDKPNTVDEVMKALKLFKKANISAGVYAMTENGKRQSF